jgi:acyl carrier protein
VKRGEALFESLVVYENYPVDEGVKEGLEGLKITEMKMEERANYPLVLVVAPGRRLTMKLVYDRERFEGETIRRAIGYLGRVLERMAANAERPVREIEVLSEEELSQILMTPGGKIDRRALPDPKGVGPELENIYVGPRTAVEEILCSIWAEMLRVDKVCVHDNFFELGGHSLIAAQLARNIEEVLHVSVSLRQLFDLPTVAGIASFITDSEAEPGKTEKIASIIIKVSNMSAESARDILQSTEKVSQDLLV